MRERTRERLKRPGGSEALTSKDVRPALPSAQADPAAAEKSPVAPAGAAFIHPPGEHFPVSEPGDALEQEADRIAGRVVRAGAWGPVGGSGSGVQGSGAGGLGSGNPQSAIRSPQSGGEALPGDLRAELEPRFGHDFSKVRVHTDAPAAESARSLNALAYTVRSDIVFGAGQFAPHQETGRMLLAHELAHVVQQDAAGPRVQRKEPPGGGTAVADPGAPRKTAGELVQEDRRAEAMKPLPPAPSGFGGLRMAEAAMDPHGATAVFHAGGQTWEFSKDPGFARYQLRNIAAGKGMAAVHELHRRLKPTYDLHSRLLKEYEAWAALGNTDSMWNPPPNMLRPKDVELLRREVPILEELLKLLPDEIQKLQKEVDQFLGEFKLVSELMVKDLLDQSEKVVMAEAERYGHPMQISTQNPTMVRGAGGFHGVSRNPEAGAMRAAAGELSKKHRQIEHMKEEQKDKYTGEMSLNDPKSKGLNVVPGSRMKMYGKDVMYQDYITDQAAYSAMDKKIKDAQKELYLLRFEKEQKYPILASYTSRDRWDDLEQLSKGEWKHTTESYGDPVAIEIEEKLSNIGQVRHKLNQGDLNVWKYAPVMDLARRQKGVQQGTFHDQIIKHKIESEKEEDRIKDIVLSVLALALGLVAAPFTGGGSLVATGAMVASAGIGAYLSFEHFQQYQVAKVTEGMAFDRAKAISMEEPSLFWLALDLVGTALDIQGALAAFRVYRAAAREIKMLGALPDAQRQRLLAMLPEELDEAKRLELLEELTRRVRAQEAEAVTRSGVNSAQRVLASPADAAAREALEKFLKENIQNRRAMAQFYQELGWDTVKGLQGKIDDRLFNAIHWARDDMLASMWGDVQREMLEQGVKLKRPYVGAPPLSREYKLAYSDVDFSVQVEAIRGKDGVWRPLTDPAVKAQFELQAKTLMEKKLAGMVPASAPHMDVNVYMHPGRLDLAAPGVKQVSKEALELEARETRVMQYYEARMGFGPDKAGVEGWNKMRERALAEARKQGPEAEKAVLQHLTEAEGRYADYQGRVGQARTNIAAQGKHDADTLDALARKQVRQEAEKELKHFLDKEGVLLDHPGREGEMARARYNALQLKVRSTWEEAYVGHAAAGWGAAGPDAGKVLGKMTEEEIRAAKISQASYIVQWGKAEDDVVRAWKCAKYDLRDAVFEAELAKRLGKTPPMAKEWEDFLKSLKASKTPDEAWSKWVQRFGSEDKARKAMNDYVAKLQEQTKTFLAKELGTPPGVTPGGPAPGPAGTGGPPTQPPPGTGGPPTTGGPGPTGGAALSGEWGVSYVTPHGETMIIDSNVAVALDKEFRGRHLTEVERKAQKLDLNDREKLAVKAAEARGVSNLAVVSRTVQEVSEKGGVEGTLLGVRHRPIPQAEKDTIMEELKAAAVGGEQGVKDREIVLQSLYSETAPGRIPQVMSADNQFVNGLARIAAQSEPGMNPAKLGKYKNVAEYLRYEKGTDSFTVRIHGRDLRVTPVQPIRPRAQIK